MTPAGRAALALLVALAIGLSGGRAVAAVDLTGGWKLDADGQRPDPFFGGTLVNFTQSGTTLTFVLPAQQYLSSTGTIDPDTGEFAAQFEFRVFFSTCAASIAGVASADGLSFTGTYQSACPLDSIFVGPVAVVGQRCGQGGIECCGNQLSEPDELCDGVCCDAGCQAYDPAGAACSNDFNTCTNDVCDGAGSCQHEPLTGQACGPDASFRDFCSPKGLCAAGVCEIVPCRTPSLGSRLVMSDAGGTRWIWRDDSGAVTGFGDPTAGATRYRLCLGTVPTSGGGFATAAGFANAWRQTQGGFRYRETTNMVRAVTLRARHGRATITARVGAAYLVLPTAQPIRMRILGVGPAPSCFEMTYTNPRVNKVGRYQARE